MHVQCLPCCRWKLLVVAVVVIVVTINSGHTLQSRKLTIGADVNVNNWHHIINMQLGTWPSTAGCYWSQEEINFSRNPPCCSGRSSSAYAELWWPISARQGKEKDGKDGRGKEEEGGGGNWLRQGWKSSPCVSSTQNHVETKYNPVIMCWTVMRLRGKTGSREYETRARNGRKRYRKLP